MLSFRQAVGGSWATNPQSWIAVFPGSALLVYLQEARTPFSQWWMLPALMIVEHLAVGAVIAAVAPLARLRWRVLPLTVVAVMWIGMALARALVGGAAALILASTPPHYADRFIFWLLANFATLPLLSFAFAQVDSRRNLLSELAAARVNLAVEENAVTQSAAELRHQLVATARSVLTPVIEEVRQGLTAVSGVIDPPALRAMSAHLSDVSGDLERILQAAPPAPMGAVAVRQRRVPTVAALDFQLSRPLYSALTASIVSFLLIVPGAFQLSGAGTAAWAAIGIAVSGVIVVLDAYALRRVIDDRMSVRVALLRIGFLTAAGCATAVLVLQAALTGTRVDVAIVIALPITIMFSWLTVTFAVGVGAANRELTEELTEVADERARLAHRRESRSRRIGRQISAVLHGPVQGRLSACAMALNFYAEAAAEAAIGATVTTVGEGFLIENVLRHLAAASHDLDALDDF